MPENITPEWLEACGFKFLSGQWHLFADRYGITVSLHPVIVVIHADSLSIRPRHPTRECVRSAWHALTGTRLVEPMPSDIAESTMILADKYEEEGFGDQAAYIRSLVSENERLKREIDEWHNDSITASALDTRVSAITSELPRPRFANDSYRFRYCDQCRGCTQHIFLSQGEGPAFYECSSCRNSGYVAPVDATRHVPMIRGECGLRPCLENERVDGFALAGELEDALNRGVAYHGELIPARGEHQPNAYS